MEWFRPRSGKKIAKKSPWGDNISFLAHYLFDNPGATSREARKALCEKNGIEWISNTVMRGQYTSYFCTGWVGNWRNPCGRYWNRFYREDGKNGYVLTLEGLSKVQLP